MIAGVPDWIIYYMIFNYVGLAVVGGYLLYRTKFKIGFLAVFVRKGHGSRRDLPTWIIDGTVIDVVRGAYTLDAVGKSETDIVVNYDALKPVKSEYVYVGEREFKVKQPLVVFGQGTYRIDLTKPAYRKFGWTIYEFDIETGNQLNFGGEFENLPPQVAERHLYNGTLRQLLLESGLPKQVLYLFLALVIMVGVSAGLGGYMLGSMGANAPAVPAELIGGVLLGAV